MVGTYAAGDDVGCEIIFAEDGRAGQAAKHGHLTYVIQGVGDGALEEAFGGALERLGRSEIIVKFLDGGEETLDFGVPWQRRRVVPGLLALRDRERPVKEIADVREDLRGSARFVADMVSGEAIGRAAQGFSAAIGYGSERVA